MDAINLISDYLYIRENHENCTMWKHTKKRLFV